MSFPRQRLSCLFQIIRFLELTLLKFVANAASKIHYMPRILSIDYGKKRTGIAVTDPAQIIANGLATVETSTLISYLADYFSHEEVERVVLGLPSQPNGQPSENQQRVLAFMEKFKNRFPDKSIELYDERFTSVLAHQVILNSGIGKKRRQQDKGLVDEISACIILQSWMESQK